MHLLDEPQPLLRGRQHGRSTRRQGRGRGQARRGCGLELSSSRARPATVGAEKSVARGSSTPKAWRTRATSRVALSEWPPRWKKSSSRAHGLDAEHLAEVLGEQLLQRAARRLALGLASVSSTRQRGQRLAIHLAAGGEGERGERDEARGHHRLGQRAGQRLAQAAHRLGRVALQHEEGLQPRVTAAAAHHHGRLAHAGLAQQGGFDLLQLDAHAAHLHLEVGASQEAQRAIAVPAATVARAVQARAGLAGERIGHEALGGQLRAAPVAAAQARAAEVQLARDTRRHGLAARVEHVHAARGPAAGRGARAGPRSVRSATTLMLVSVGP